MAEAISITLNLTYYDESTATYKPTEGTSPVVTLSAAQYKDINRPNSISVKINPV